MKTVIMGYSGSGKSTLAAAIAQKEQIPALYLDTVYWLPGWEPRDLEGQIRQVKAFLAEHENWVIDGNYRKVCFEERMEQADRIVFLNFDRFASLCRAWKRYLRYKGKSRVSMTEGCEEKFDWNFFCWILWKGRTKVHRERFVQVVRSWPQKTVVIKNQRQLTAFYRENGLEMTE